VELVWCGRPTITEWANSAVYFDDLRTERVTSYTPPSRASRTARRGADPWTNRVSPTGARCGVGASGSIIVPHSTKTVCASARRQNTPGSRACSSTVRSHGGASAGSASAGHLHNVAAAGRDIGEHVLQQVPLLAASRVRRPIRWVGGIGACATVRAYSLAPSDLLGT
jgi:hypothetical protein